MDTFLRRATPLVLLALAALAWFGAWMPGHSELAARFGDDAVLRFVVGLLCIYMVMLVVERQRLEVSFKQLLGAFKDYHQQARSGMPTSEAPEAKREAAQILVGALSSADPELRETALVHLKRLSGEDFGADADAWRSWLDSESKSP